MNLETHIMPRLAWAYREPRGRKVPFDLDNIKNLGRTQGKNKGLNAPLPDRKCRSNTFAQSILRHWGTIEKCYINNVCVVHTLTMR
jgi:hypothetical protein